ncbi:MAG: mechanosensitive ion channel, partial [Tenericutes bacterium]|nr:mechanosensitive ion channel [Mycoplasmatota bacterium]
FYTTAISSDNKTIQLPNGSLSNSNITNFTANKTRMLEMNVSVKYNSDIETVKKVLLNAVNKTDLVLKDENILIRMKDYTDTSATYIVKVWTNTSDYSNATFDLKENIKIAIDENKI